MKRIQTNQIRNEKGFSMIEMMLALTILLVGLLAVAQMQITAIQGNASANRLSMATTIGSDRLERLIRLSNTHADLSDGNHEDPENPVDGYTITWTVTSDTEGKSKSIKLTLAWQERSISKHVVFDYLKPTM